MIYAKIENAIVVNLLELDTYNANDFPNCIDTQGLDVQIGDSYSNEKFYRDGKELLFPNQKVERVINSLTEKIRRDEIKIRTLTDELATTNDVLQDLILATMGG